MNDKNNRPEIMYLILGDFRMFDYGPQTNMKIYNNYVPPRYELERISAPSTFFHGDNDWLAHPIVRTE